MPAVPYAKCIYTVNAGANQSGANNVPASATIVLHGESVVGWITQLWEIYEYPAGFACPSGWTNVNGSYVNTSVTPPSFAIGGSALWGKYFFRLTVNGGLLNGLYQGPTAVQPLVDKSSTVQCLSPKSLRDIGFNEDNEWDVVRQWIGELKADLRQIDTLVQTAGGGLGAVTFTVDGASGAITAGQAVTMAPGGVTVTLATAAAITAAGGILGIANGSATAGGQLVVSVETMVPASISLLAAGVAAYVRINSTSHQCERVTSFSIGDVVVGTCNASGDVLMVRGVIVGAGPTGNAGGALSGTYPNPSIVLGGNSGLTGTLEASKQAVQTMAGDVTGNTGAAVVARLNGSTVPAGGALTVGNVPYCSGAAALSYGPLTSGLVPTPQVKKTANYTINLSTDSIIYIDTTAGPITLQWPTHKVGGEIWIKDVGASGILATNNLTIARVGAENIDNVAANRVLSAPGGAWLISDDGTNLWVHS